MRAIDTAKPSLAHLYLERVTATPNHAAYLVPAYEGWRSVRWSEVHDEVRLVSTGLRTLGVEVGAIQAQTSLRWLIADFALIMAGLPVATVYPSTDPATRRAIVEDAEAGVLFIDSMLLDDLIADWPPTLAHAVVLVGTSGDPRIESWESLKQRGQAWLERHGETLWVDEARSLQPDDLATLIYTSGTTGVPKGVRLTHGNWLAQCVTTEVLMGRYAEQGDLLYLWLPLAHAYGKVLEVAGLATGVTTVVDGDHRRIPQVLEQTGPSWVPAVPRVFEKLRSRILQRGVEAGPRVERVIGWALDVAIQIGRHRAEGTAIPLRLAIAHQLADTLVLRKIRAGAGGRIRGFLCGSAPLDAQLELLFLGIGMPIYQGYGMTECAAIATANLPGEVGVGTVGRPVDGMQVRIHEGEVQLKGPMVMQGYHRRPEANQATLVDGWLRTGDLGELVDGRLKITGRRKEILITSGGKNVAPAPIESAVKARCGLIQEVVLLGDRRPTVMALVTVDPEMLEPWAAARGIAAEPLAPEVREAIEHAVHEVNEGLASFQAIKGFAILPRPFSEATGELTPSQKVRRNLVVERYADVVDRLYA